MLGVGRRIGALAEAVLGHAQKVMPLLCRDRADDLVAIAQRDAANACGDAAHHAHVVLIEAVGVAILCRDEDLLRPVGLKDRDEPVALTKIDDAQAVVAKMLQRAHAEPLDRAALGGHEEIERLVVDRAGVDDGLDLFAGLDLQDIHEVRALGGLAGLGDVIALLAEDTAGVGEEEQIVVRRGREDIDDGVLLAGRDALLAHAAAALGVILAQRRALDVAGLSQCEDAGLLVDQILDVDLVLDLLDLGEAVVAELVGDGLQLIFQDRADEGIVGEHLLIIADLLFEFLVLGLELFPVETLQSPEAHVEDRLGLDLVEPEALHEVLARVVVARADDADDLVDVVLRDQQTLEQMRALLCLFEVKTRTADDDLFLESEILIDDVAQGQNARLLLVVDEREHIDRKARLKLALRKEAVHHDLRVRVSLELDDDAHAVAVGLIAKV